MTATPISSWLVNQIWTNSDVPKTDKRAYMDNEISTIVESLFGLNTVLTQKSPSGIMFGGEMLLFIFKKLKKFLWWV